MPDKSLDWLKEIEIEDLLENDTKFIAEAAGIDLLLDLWTHFPKMTLCISTKPLTRAKKRYIKKYAGIKTVKELCHTLDVSEKFVYDAMSQANVMEGQGSLFEKSA
ncbi:MAG TPA: hypothetical protein PLX02_12175 [Syntrophorhabdaceae bacterium]|nr:hypothetical protein [Syntrophorhabdaceae bacterium]HQM82369.1 hypothetical protein [Syntrophorhabdaceae bacterium]